MGDSPLGLLGRLPLELRNQIYHLILREQLGEKCTDPRCYNTWTKDSKSRFPVITLISRPIGDETVGLYFYMNTFTVRTDLTEWHPLIHWIEQVSTARYLSLIHI